MMAKMKLDIESPEAIELLGIQCSWPAHRFVWSLNRTLDVALSRDKDYVLETSSSKSAGGLFDKEESRPFSVYRHENDLETLLLISNLSGGLALYDKGRSFDYLLHVESMQRDLSELIDDISDMPAVLAAARVTCRSGERAARPFEIME